MQKVSSFAVVDVETTGLGNIDRVVEVAVVLLDPLTLSVTDEFDSLINPLRDVGPTRIHGISASMVSAAPTFEEVARHLASFLDGSILIAHNLPFDSRFLSQEFQRSGISGHLGNGLCTLRATRQALGAACASLGIDLSHGHRALADARATSEVFRRLRASGLLVEGEPAEFEDLVPESLTRTLRREHSDSRQIQTTIPPLRFALPGGGDSQLSYLNMVDRYLSDGVLSVEEQESLADLATLFGLQDEVSTLHIRYVQSIWDAAWRDGVLSEHEIEFLRKASQSLGVELDSDRLTPEQPPELALSKDTRVCFTGDAMVEGRSWSRSDLHALALRNGFIPVDNVTKKSCDLLVAADTSTLSGKAKKARDWDIPIVSVDEFVRKLS